MIKNNRIILLFALFTLSIGLIGCGGAQTTTDNKGTNIAANNAKPAENKAEANKPAENTNKPADKTEANKTEANKTETASAADEIGVPECDKFIKNYETCLFDKVPEAQRVAFKPGLDQWKKSWKDLAANPSTKGTLAQACKTAAETAKTSMASFSCKWD